MLKSFVYLMYIHMLAYLEDIRQYIYMIAAMVVIIGLVVTGTEAMTKAENDSPVSIGLKMDAEGAYSMMLRSAFFNEKAYDGVVDIDAVKDGDVLSEFDAMVHVPEDFFDALMYFEHLPVKVFINTESPVIRYLLYDMIQSYSIYIRSVEASVTSLYRMMKDQGYESDELFEYNEKLALKLIQMALRRDEMVYTSVIGFYTGVELQDYYFMALMTMVTWFLSLSIGMKWLQTEHDEILKRYLITGRSLLLYLTAFFIVSVSVLYTFAVTVIIGLTWMDLIDIRNLSGYLLIVLLMCCVYCSFMMFAANLFRDRNMFAAIAVIYGVLASLAGGVIMPLFEMSKSMLRLSNFTPNYWFIRLQIIFYKNEVTMEATAVITFMVVLCLVVIWLSSMTTIRRWQEASE